MINYFDKVNNTFDCEKAYKFFIGEIGTTQISRMSDDEYLKFKTLCHLKRNNTILNLEEANKKKNSYLTKNHHLSEDEAKKINLLDLL